VATFFFTCLGISRAMRALPQRRRLAAQAAGQSQTGYLLPRCLLDQRHAHHSI